MSFEEQFLPTKVDANAKNSCKVTEDKKEMSLEGHFFPQGMTSSSAVITNSSKRQCPLKNILFSKKWIWMVLPLLKDEINLFQYIFFPQKMHVT